MVRSYSNVLLPVPISVLVCFSVASIKHLPKALWRRKGLFGFQVVVYHWGNPRWELEAESTEKHCFLLVCFNDLLSLSPFLRLIYSYFLCMGAFPVWLLSVSCACSVHRPEEDIESPRTGVTEPLKESYLNPGPLKEKQVPLSAEPSLY